MNDHRCQRTGGDAMTGRPDDQPDHRMRFLQGQLDVHAQIAEDIVEIATHTWAIHGSIAVDGEVIMAVRHPG